METKCGDYIISYDKEKIQLERIKEMLSNSYWAKERSIGIIKKTIENSICFGIYINDHQVGFARCVTDYSTMYWIGDVIIDDAHRGLGLGKSLIEAITNHDDLKPLRGILETKDAHGLYKQYGFYSAEGKYMRKEKPE